MRLQWKVRKDSRTEAVNEASHSCHKTPDADQEGNPALGYMGKMKRISGKLADIGFHSLHHPVRR